MPSGVASPAHSGPAATAQSPPALSPTAECGRAPSTAGALGPGVAGGCGRVLTHRAAASRDRPGGHGLAQADGRRDQEAGEDCKKEKGHPHLPGPGVRPSRVRGSDRPQDGPSRIEDANAAQTPHRRRALRKFGRCCHAGPRTPLCSAITVVPGTRAAPLVGQGRVAPADCTHRRVAEQVRRQVVCHSPHPSSLLEPPKGRSCPCPRR